MLAQGAGTTTSIIISVCNRACRRLERGGAQSAPSRWLASRTGHRAGCGTCEGRALLHLLVGAQVGDGRGRRRRQAALVPHAVLVAGRARCGHRTRTSQAGTTHARHTHPRTTHPVCAPPTHTLTRSYARHNGDR